MKLTEKGRQQVIDIVEKSTTSRYDEIVIFNADNMVCFENTENNPGIGAAQKAMHHYKCSWGAAEDIVARVVGWLDEAKAEMEVAK